MKFKQKKFNTTLEFELEDDLLVYKVDDRDGSASNNIQYEDISNDVTEYKEKNQWYRNVGLIWIIVGLIITFMSMPDGIKLSIWVPIGVLFYIIYLIYQIPYTKIDANNYIILVIKNKKHDKIVKEIFEHRNLYLRRKYAKIEIDSSKERELNKFKFLKEVGAIGEDEFNDFEKIVGKEFDKNSSKSKENKSS